MKISQRHYLDGLRVEFSKFVLPKVAEAYLGKDFAEPAKIIARTAWNIANELAKIELDHRIKEEKEDDDDN